MGILFQTHILCVRDAEKKMRLEGAKRDAVEKQLLKAKGEFREAELMLKKRTKQRKEHVLVGCELRRREEELRALEDEVGQLEASISKQSVMLQEAKDQLLFFQVRKVYCKCTKHMRHTYPKGRKTTARKQ